MQATTTSDGRNWSRKTRRFEVRRLRVLFTGATDKVFLEVDYSKSCRSAEHRAYAMYAGLMILVYIIGTPLTFVLLLSRKRAVVKPNAREIAERILSHEPQSDVFSQHLPSNLEAQDSALKLSVQEADEDFAKAQAESVVTIRRLASRLPSTSTLDASDAIDGDISRDDAAPALADTPQLELMSIQRDDVPQDGDSSPTKTSDDGLLSPRNSCDNDGAYLCQLAAGYIKNATLFDKLPAGGKHRTKYTLRRLGDDFICAYNRVNPDTSHLQLLFADYSPEYWWFESFECARPRLFQPTFVTIVARRCLRRLTLTAFIPLWLSPRDDRLALLYATCAVSLIFFLIYLLAKPFAFDEVNKFACVIQCTLSLILLITICLFVDDNLEEDLQAGWNRAALGYTLVFLSVALGPMIICFLARSDADFGHIASPSFYYGWLVERGRRPRSP